MKFKLLLVGLVGFMLGSLAMGSAPTCSTTPSTKWSADLPDFVTPEFPEMAKLVKPATQSTQSAAPLDFTYQATTDGNRYALTSKVVLPDFRGWRGVNGVAIAGYRLDGNLPVLGAGLEYMFEIPIDGNFRITLNPTLSYLFEQGQALDKGVLRFGLVAGVRF